MRALRAVAHQVPPLRGKEGARAGIRDPQEEDVAAFGVVAAEADALVVSDADGAFAVTVAVTPQVAVTVDLWIKRERERERGGLGCGVFVLF